MARFCRSRASYLRVEKGNQQPRSLAAAFFNPVRGDDLLVRSITEIETLATGMNKAYGACFDADMTMDVAAGRASLAELCTFAAAE